MLARNLSSQRMHLECKSGSRLYREYLGIMGVYWGSIGIIVIGLYKDYRINVNDDRSTDVNACECLMSGIRLGMKAAAAHGSIARPSTICHSYGCRMT